MLMAYGTKNLCPALPPQSLETTCGPAPAQNPSNPSHTKFPIPEEKLVPSLIKFQPIHTALVTDSTNVVAANQIHCKEDMVRRRNPAM